jgi:crotonobetainyl-CoA:carnitine CoA-transferase CaiB-like acyl-CoA transferase
MTQVMQGIRIVEVAEYTFVPAASAILADWGAEVIKIEHPERGDASRGLASSGRVNYNQTAHVLVEHSNRGKQSLGLDLTSPEGRAILYRLVETADVFITNKLPAVSAKLQVDVADIRAHNPDIIYVRGTGYGVRGPDVNDGGFDFLGFWSRAASADALRVGNNPPPAPPGPAYGDNIGAMFIAGGVAAALMHRERTGEAVEVDVSLLAAGMWAMASPIGLSQLSGERHDGQTLANGTAPSNPLSGLYRTSDDRYVALNMLQGFHYWPEACERLGHPEWIVDPRFASVTDLRANAGDAAKLVAGAIASETLGHWKARFRGMKGPWSVVQDTLEVASDPMTIANGYMQELKSHNGDVLRVVSAPVQFNGSPGITRRAPGFNEHGDDILIEQLGMDWDTVIDLKLRGIIV